MRTHELVAHLIKLHPPLKELFLNPDYYALAAYSARSVAANEARVSDELMAIITMLFQQNGVNFTLEHKAGQGWCVGFTLPSGIKGVQFESEGEDRQFNKTPGRALLGALWAMIEQCHWRPLVMSKSDWVNRESLNIAVVRVEP